SRSEPRLRLAAREAARWELPDPREAEVVVGVGMGLKRRENVAYAVELAKPLGGAVDATRNVVHAGWPSPHPPPYCELVEAGSARVFLMRWMVYVVREVGPPPTS
ncbi:MAG: FAD-binding protein, partial [Pyrobaculum sp.]